MGELVEAAGRSMHIQKQIREIDLGEHACDRGAQCHQGSRFRHGLQLVEPDPRPCVGQLEGGIVGQPGSHVPVGCVQPSCQLGQVGVGSFRKTEGGDHLRHGALPRIAVEQPGSRIAPAVRTFGVHVA